VGRRVTGAGRGLCSGLDLEDHGTPPGCDGLPMSRIAIRAMEYMSNLRTGDRAIPQPIVAAVNGPAYGGGMCLMLGSDLRLAPSRRASAAPASPMPDRHGARRQLAATRG